MVNEECLGLLAFKIWNPSENFEVLHAHNLLNLTIKPGVQLVERKEVKPQSN